MIENPLKFTDGFGGLTCREVGQTANVDGVQTAEASDEADGPRGEIVARGGLQCCNRRRCISAFSENKARSVGRYMN